MYDASILNWMLQMFHTYVAIVCSKYFICSSLPFYLDVAYVFTHLLQVYFPDISSQTYVAFNCFMHVARVSYCLESQGCGGVMVVRHRRRGMGCGEPVDGVRGARRSEGRWSGARRGGMGGAIVMGPT
jgi:hypothetical protein